MPPIRFIHAADLHLDAAFSGLSRDIPADFAERLRTATFTAFRRLLDLCERESPDFLLLAGDVYNQEDASVSAQLALRDGFRRLESLSIPVFLVHGNHDPLASRLRSVRWPGNVTVFGELPDAVPVFRKGEGTPLAIIHGASHASGRETRNLAALFRRTEACGLHVGLLHATPGDADGVARYAPFSQGDLKASGMDYWALGHIHDRREVCREPLAAYPGCTQGLHINEPGEKGCLLVTAEARPDGGYAVRTSFRPLGPAVWKTLDMDLGGAASLDELENRLRTGLDRAAAEVWSGCEMLLVRLRLQGRTELDGLLRKGTTCAELAARDLYGADADIPAFFASFGEADKEVLEAELASLAGRLSMLADEEERLADSLRTQEVRLEQAEGSGTLSRLRLRAASLSGTIRGLGLEWSRYALARHLLLEARGRFEKERQPGVIRAASALFSAITGGAWVGIAASLEDSSLRVLPPHGEPVSPEVLSRGTQEQLYLALRLAHIRNHAAQAAALPVIMDDVLVNFDPDRALRTAQTFGDLASSQEGSPGHQLLYFTCHPHMADMLRKAVPGVGLYVMERGTIREEE